MKKLFATIFILALFAPNAFCEQMLESAMPNIGKIDLKKDPTYINSDSLTLTAKEREFIYEGHVVVKNNDMELKADKITGYYTKDNKLDKLVAVGNVVMTKGTTMRARSQEATYDAVKKIVTLSKNPELEKDKSLLMADEIKVYIEEERSTAIGQVRVKLLQ